MPENGHLNGPTRGRGGSQISCDNCDRIPKRGLAIVCGFIRHHEKNTGRRIRGRVVTALRSQEVQLDPSASVFTCPALG